MVLIALLMVALSAEELTPAMVAAIEREQTKAFSAIDEKYGNKKPSELTSTERAAISKERGDAERKVLDKHGVSFVSVLLLSVARPCSRALRCHRRSL